MNGIESCIREKPDILEYNQRDYQKNYSAEFITGFHHGSMAKGPVDVKSVEAFVATLNEKVVNVTTAVSFKQEAIQPILEGGSCSSIALRVCQAALITLQQLDCQSSDLIDSVKAKIDQINALSPSGRKEVRSVQAAFNTIQVDTSMKVDDICQNKIKALAAFYDLKVCQSTEELAIEKSDDCERKFAETIKTLNPGVYLVRILQKEENHKLEKQGHSTVYIKDQHGEELYFDTQLGLYHVSEAQDLIYRSICSALRRFGVNACKFHQLLL